HQGTGRGALVGSCHEGGRGAGHDTDWIMMAPMSGGATRRDLLFAAAGLLVCGPAWAVSESHDVSYGVGPNRADLEARRAVVARVLGPGVARQLAIVQLKEGRYALVYRRGGDL